MRLVRSMLLIATAMIFVGVASTPDAHAGWFRRALSRARRIARDAVKKTKKVAGKVKKAVSSGAKKAVKKIGNAAKKAGKSIANAAKSAWSGAKAFGDKAWRGIKNAANKAWGWTKKAAQAAAKKMKAAAKWVTNKILAGLIKKAKYYQKKYASLINGYKKKFKDLLGNSKWKGIIKRITGKIASKKVDKQLKSDMMAIARKLGIRGAKWACAPGRREGQAPCGDCAIGAFSLAINAGVAAVAGVEGYGGFALGKGGGALFGGWGWSLGVQAEAGADIVLGLMPNVKDIDGDGVGFSIAGKYIGGAGFGIDWAGSNLKSIGSGCPSFEVAGGVGVGGGINVGWSHSYSTNK